MDPRLRAALVRCVRELGALAHELDASAGEPVAERFWLGESRAHPPQKLAQPAR
jgi:hypothetical protein